VSLFGRCCTYDRISIDGLKSLKFKVVALNFNAIAYNLRSSKAPEFQCFRVVLQEYRISSSYPCFYPLPPEGGSVQLIIIGSAIIHLCIFY